MRIAFIVDPLEVLKPYKDSSVAMMRRRAAFSSPAGESPMRWPIIWSRSWASCGRG